MDEDEFLEELNKKLIEETKEYIEDENIEEIADILEVIYGILKAKGVSFEEVEKIRLEKKHKRGGFEEKIKLVKVIEQVAYLPPKFSKQEGNCRQIQKLYIY